MLLEREREIVVRHAQRLAPDGLAVGTAGNVSARAGDLVAITPSAVPYDELHPGLVCVVGLDGIAVDAPAPPSTELPMHLAAYRATGAGAVVHTHSPYATVLSTVVEELPAIHYLIATLGGPVRVAPYADPGSDALADALTAALDARTGAILGNHGAVTVGDDLPAAYSRARTLEWLAATFWRASALGTPRVLTTDELDRAAGLMARYG